MRLVKIIYTFVMTLVVQGIVFPVFAQTDSTKLADKVMSGNEMNFGALFFKTMFSLLLVILLLVAFVYGLKWLQKKMQGGYLHEKNMSVLDNLVLGPKKQLHLVKLLDRVMLLSSSEDQINYLLELTPEEIKQLKDQDIRTKPFAKTLSEQITKFGTDKK